METNTNNTGTTYNLGSHDLVIGGRGATLICLADGEETLFERAAYLHLSASGNNVGLSNQGITGDFNKKIVALLVRHGFETRNV